MESPTAKRELLERLVAAYQCCEDCGDKYGSYRAGASSQWHDNCDVCGAEAVVTETRDYGYLYKGIRLLKNF